MPTRLDVLHIHVRRYPIADSALRPLEAVRTS